MTAVALAASLIFAACGSSPSKAGSATPTTAHSGPSGSTPIVVGVLMSQSGTYGPVGSELIKGINFAIEQVNASGGIAGRPIEVKLEDWRSETSVLTNLATKLIQDKAVAVLGPETSGGSALLEPFFSSSKVPNVTTAGSKPKGAYSFTVQPLSGYFTLTTDFAKSRAATKMCLMGISGAPFESVKQVIEPAAKATGLPMGPEVAFDATLPDLRPQLTQLKTAGCTAIFDGGTGSSLAVVANDMAQLGMADSIVVTQGSNASTSVLRQLGSNSSLVYFGLPKVAVASVLPASDPDLSAIKPLVDAWTEKFGTPPDVDECLGYADAKVLITALQKGGATAQAIHDYLESGALINTPFVPYKFAPSNHAGAQADGWFVLAKRDPSTHNWVIGYPR